MKKNIIIASTVILSLGLLIWGIEFLKGVNLFKPANYYYAKFEKVDGLVEAAPVMINGFQVGQVRELTYDFETNQISVMLNMNKDLKIPVGSTVYIESSLTGGATMSIALAKSDNYYEVGSVLEGSSPNGLMEQLTDNMMPQIDNMLPKVDSILGNVNSLVGDPALAESVARLNAITLELAKSSEQLTLLMNNLNKSVPGVMSNVDGVVSNVNGVVTNVNGVVTNANGIVTSAKGMVANLNSATSNIDRFSNNLSNLPLDSTLNTLNGTVANLQMLTNKLNDNNSSLGLLLNDKSLYNNLDRTVISLDSLFIDIKKNPKRYINIKLL